MTTYLSERELEDEITVQVELAAAARGRGEVAALAHLAGPDLAVLAEPGVVRRHVRRVEHHGAEERGTPEDCEAGSPPHSLA